MFHNMLMESISMFLYNTFHFKSLEQALNKYRVGGSTSAELLCWTTTESQNRERCLEHLSVLFVFVCGSVDSVGKKGSFFLFGMNKAREFELGSVLQAPDGLCNTCLEKEELGRCIQDVKLYIVEL